MMEGSDNSPPLSLGVIIRKADFFKKSTLEKEDDKLTIPFSELPGESVRYLGRTDDGVLALSNYRLFLLKSSINSETSVPLGLIESAQIRDLFHLTINCKDANTIKCSFATSENCNEWLRRIGLSIGIPDELESLFAFPFYAWSSETITSDNEWSGQLRKHYNCDNDFYNEVKRLKFDLKSSWRISEVNKDFKLCPSYPRYILVPHSISDETLVNVASFRSSRRIPAIVWRHRRTGAVIARCSQPEVGWLGWRNSKDEQLLKAISDACESDKPYRARQNSYNSDIISVSSSSPQENNIDKETATNSSEPKKILIVDARSYTSAVTNRARGGGCECAEYYPCAEIQFMNLGNIHAIRKSFHAVRTLCASPPDTPNWLGLLEKTAWLQHMSGLIAASMVVCHSIERQGKPVLVHCSDGWDRTPQIVATAQLCLDPYYRTVEGFRILVEREWLNFGHKFADRCGHGPGSDEINERCPVFLQWLDCIHQIHRQFPCSFEFSMGYLIKLAQHSNSCLFGTFLCNTVKERLENSVNSRTFSVWPFLSGPIYKNPLYVPNREKVLWPAHNVRDLVLWREIYLGSLGNKNSLDEPPRNTTTDNGGIIAVQESINPMTKTRSYGDLVSAGELQGGLARRSSDPNMIMDSHNLTALNNSIDNSLDSSSEHNSSPPALIEKNHLMTASLKIPNLTNDLNQSDEEEISISEHQNLNFLTKNNNNLKNCNNLDIDVKGDNDNDYSHHIDNNEDDNNGKNIPKHLNNGIKNDNDKNNIDDDDDDDNLSKFIYHQQKNIKNDNKNFIKKYHNGTINNKIETIKYQNGKDLIKNNNVNCDDENDDDDDDDNNVDVGNIDDEDDEVKKLTNNLNLDEDDDENDVTIKINGQGNNDVIDGGYCDTEVMMQCIDLNDTSNCDSPIKSVSQNLWYGSVETSTDTLVPIEKSSSTTTESITNQTEINLMTDSNENDRNLCLNAQPVNNIINGDQFDGGGCGVVGVINGSVCGSDVGGYIGGSYYSSDKNGKSRTISTSSQMDESIVIQPEFEKLYINGTKIDRRKNFNDYSPNKQYVNGSTSPSVSNSRFSTPGGRSLPLTPPGGAATDRPPATISCPDGLAHALSEQNLRLQQIVYEHKLREEALQKELYATRLELLRKTCQQCSTHAYFNEEPDEETSLIFSRSLMKNRSTSEFSLDKLSSINDSNLENASVCSWEAVEDGNVQGINFGQPMNDYWVPDHAVSQCTGCNMVFWLGRRKHHCRSCGQIFCADCSEYRASLPDKRLYSTVRLCATCYNNQVCTTTNSTSTISQERVPINSSILSNNKYQLSAKTLESYNNHHHHDHGQNFI